MHTLALFPALSNPNDQLNFVSGHSTARIMHVAHQRNSSDAQAGVQIGSWSFYGVLLSEERMTSREGTFRVTRLANTVPNKESLSPKGFTNRRSGPIYFEVKVLIAECVCLLYTSPSPRD